MKLKRLTRRCTGVVLGLWLGWLAAGWLSSASMAEEAATTRLSPAAEVGHLGGEGDSPTNGAGHGDQPVHDSHGAHEPHAPHDDHAAVPAAQRLVPQAGDIRWFPTAVGIGVALFACALAAGLAARRAGVREPNVQAGLDDQAAAHGHEPHGASDEHASAHLKAGHH